MHIIIGGCGRLGAEIAEQLSVDADTDVVILDTDPMAFDRLGAGFNGETLVGDCTDRDVLEQAGIARADGLIAVTRSDNANLMTVEIATHLYDVPRTIARLFNPEREDVYRKLGVRYVSSTNTIAKLFLNEFRDDAFPLHVSFIDTDVSVVDLEIDTSAHGMDVADFEQDGLLRIAAVRRGARVFIPDASDRLEYDDVITVAMKPGARRGLGSLVRNPYDRARVHGQITPGGVPATKDKRSDATEPDPGQPDPVQPATDSPAHGVGTERHAPDTPTDADAPHTEVDRTAADTPDVTGPGSSVPTPQPDRDRS
ncbi:MAG: TrkA family potassium uptake protein [Nitriliruptoraceae bacterium]